MTKNKKCENCPYRTTCGREAWAWFFIVLGFISTVAIRVVTLLMHLNPIYGKVAWYVGVTGFVIFFIYKYKIFSQRARLINEGRLLDKLASPETMTDADRQTITLILCQIRSQKERVNFFFIFFASLVSLILAIYLDFFA